MCCEADIVIILECNNDNFPLMNPENEIGLLFDRTLKLLLDEELRLFYVAITRGKQQVFLLSEKNNQSDFLRCLTTYISIYSN